MFSAKNLQALPTTLSESYVVTLPTEQRIEEIKLLAAKQATTGAARGPVFMTPRGNELQVRYLVREFCEARDRAGIPDFRFHDMRHTFATRLVQRGVDLYKVQRLLGHKTSLMTQRYAHHSPESLRDGVNVLDELQPQRVSTNLAHRYGVNPSVETPELAHSVFIALSLSLR